MSTINQQPVPDEKRLCTGDVWCGCTCHACTVTFEHCVTPTPAVSDKLGTELLFDGLANLLTMAREDLSDLFEAPSPPPGPRGPQKPPPTCPRPPPPMRRCGSWSTSPQRGRICSPQSRNLTPLLTVSIRRWPSEPPDAGLVLRMRAASYLHQAPQSHRGQLLAP